MHIVWFHLCEMSGKVTERQEAGQWVCGLGAGCEDYLDLDIRELWGIMEVFWNSVVVVVAHPHKFTKIIEFTLYEN